MALELRSVPITTIPLSAKNRASRPFPTPSSITGCRASCFKIERTLQNAKRCLQDSCRSKSYLRANDDGSCGIISLFDT